MRILLADATTLHRRGLYLILTTEFPGSEVVEAASLTALSEAIASDDQIDLVVVDSRLFGRSALERVDALVAIRPAVPIVTIVDAGDDDFMIAAVRLGIRGVVERTATVDVFRNALVLACSGETYVPLNALLGPGSRNTLAAPVAEPAVEQSQVMLSARQQDVATMLVRGLSNREIAEELGLLESTIKTHLKVIMSKLGATNRTQAALLALSLGLSDTGVTTAADGPQTVVAGRPPLAEAGNGAVTRPR